MGGWWRWALVSPDGVAPSRMVGVSASVNLPLHYKVQKFSSDTSSPGWSRKKGHKTVVVVVMVVSETYLHCCLLIGCYVEEFSFTPRTAVQIGQHFNILQTQ